MINYNYCIKIDRPYFIFQLINIVERSNYYTKSLKLNKNQCKRI